MFRTQFAFDHAARALLPVIGVRPSNCVVEVNDTALTARFGPWELTTPLANISGVCVTGPYLWIKAIGPRGSMVDRGATFGTNARAGCCVTFHTPVGALLGPDRFLHPGLTVTVTDPDDLAQHLLSVVPGITLQR
ncbi:MAG: hypothetical protein WD007_03425 [Nitriliruptoraceae bacterium]